MIESIVLTIALIMSVLFVTTTINSWIALIVIKENYTDQTWLGRLVNLCIAVVSWVIWLQLIK